MYGLGDSRFPVFSEWVDVEISTLEPWTVVADAAARLVAVEDVRVAVLERPPVRVPLSLKFQGPFMMIPVNDVHEEGTDPQLPSE